MNWLALLEELSPLAQVAVAMVQTMAPPSATGSQKFAAAQKAITDTVTAASSVSGAYAQTQAALATGDAASVAVASTNAIETALSIFKTFKLFPKAAIVQSAPALGAAAPAPAAALGAGMVNSGAPAGMGN